jgi:hypothetical protein
MKPRLLSGAGALLLCSASALAVGLGPLTKQGVTDGPRKAFFLTLINPYPAAETFRAYAVGMDDEIGQPRVRIVPETSRIGGRSNRRIIVIAKDIAPGETFAFRVCAERAQQNEGMIHARVCSKLSARRLPPVVERAGGGGQ